MEPLLPTKFIDSLRQEFLQGDDSTATKLLEARHVRLVQDQYRAIAHGDFAAYLNSLAEDIEFEILGPSTIPFVGRHHGRDKVAEAVRNNFSFLENQQPEIQTVVAQGDTVVVHGQERGRVRATSRSYHIHWVQIFTFRDDKVVRFREVFDSAGMLEAVQAAPEACMAGAES